jgi:hypothetical protein
VFSDQDAAFDWATRSNGVLFVRDSYKNKLPVAKWTSLEQLRKYVVVSPALPMKK